MSKVYQVSIEVSGQGYVEVEADSAEDARVRVRRSEPRIKFSMFSGIDPTLFNEYPTVTVYDAHEVEQEEPAGGTAVTRAAATPNPGVLSE
jgi:hypothetical protein